MTQPHVPPNGMPPGNQSGPYWQGQPPQGQPPHGQYQGQPGAYPGQQQGGPYGQAPQGQWGTYGQQQFQAPPRKPGKAAKTLTILGAAFLAIGIALVVMFAVRIAGVVPGGDALIPVDGPTQVDISGSEMLVIYASDTATTCSVQAPGGQEPDLRLGSSMNFTSGDVQYTAIGKIGGEGEASGAYTVECDSANAVIGPPLSVADITTAVLLAVAGFGAGFVGLIMLIVGLVLRSSRRKRNS